ncbi:MAG TPA: hypothetical protein VJ843_05565 [Candidatus Saccharimonadales bacterium]|nr:hypothetical protein [Candidatus Saccharimonadales bacterium]
MSKNARSLTREFVVLMYWSLVGIGLAIVASCLQIPAIVGLVALLPVGLAIAKFGWNARDAVVMVALAILTYTYLVPAIVG